MGKHVKTSDEIVETLREKIIEQDMSLFNGVPVFHDKEDEEVWDGKGMCGDCGWSQADHKLNDRDEIICPGDEDYPAERGGNLGEVIDRRVQVYGDPVIGFAEIAEMWTTYVGYPIQAHQVPMMMLLMKVVRSKTSPDYSDHSDDIEGYLDIFRKIIGEDMIQARSVNEYIEKKWPGES